MVFLALTPTLLQKLRHQLQQCLKASFSYAVSFISVVKGMCEPEDANFDKHVSDA